jgi:hypothetical protein
LAAGVGVFQLGYVVSGMRGTSSSLGIESAQAYIDVFDVALVDTLAWLPGAGFVGDKQRKRLCRKAASNSGPLKVGSDCFRNEIILSWGPTAKLIVNAYVHANVPGRPRLFKVCLSLSDR